MEHAIALISLLSLLVGCYGPASHETCTAKHITNGRGGPAAYERCMETAEREQDARDYRAAVAEARRQERLNLRYGYHPVYIAPVQQQPTIVVNNNLQSAPPVVFNNNQQHQE